MRLTNEMRDDFTAAVMKHVPLKSKWDQKAVTAEIEKRLRATYPIDLKAFIAKYPQQVNFTSNWLNWLSYSDNTAKGERVSREARIQIVEGYGDLSTIETTDLKELWKDWLRERNDRAVLAQRIRSQTCAAATTQQLAVLFPDMTTLIPEEEAKKPKTALVAATGIVDDLKKLGMEIPV